MRKTSVLFLACAVIVMVTAQNPAKAQYLYVDSNGDGLSTASDRLNATGPTRVSIWLRTDTNKDGSKAVYARSPSQPLTMFSYEFILHAAGGTVKWGAYTNLIATMGDGFGEFSNATDFYTGHGGLTPLPPGKHQLGTLTVTAASGDPRLSFASTTSIRPDLHTSFGSLCIGKDGDHTLKYTDDPSQVGVAPQEVAGDCTGADGTNAPAGAALASGLESSSQSQAPHPDGVSPNPLHPQGWITFTMKLPGFARVTLFDTNGRLVRTLLDRQDLGQGTQSVRIDGLNRQGKRLGSGVYFYRIETSEGMKQGRCVVLK